MVVPPEVICGEEQEHPSARLVADELGLLRCGRPGEQQGRARGAGRRDHDPPLVLLGLVGVLDQREMERAAVEGNGLVVVTDDEGDVDDRLAHRAEREETDGESRHFTGCLSASAMALSASGPITA